jgi:chromosome segregation ATPase
MVRKVMLVLALVGAFQAGRLLPARAGWPTQTYSATAYAQAPEELGDLDAFADQVAYETLLQLAVRAPAISEALRLEMSELTALIQERLGPEVEQLHGQAVTAQSALARTQGVLSRSDRTINRSEDVIDDTNDTLDETEDTLDETEDTLDDTEDTLSETEEMLAETRRTLQRSRDLLAETEQLAAEAQELADRLADDIEDVRAILDRLPVGP